MHVGIRRTISEVDERDHDTDSPSESRERDVHFFIPSSRRQSEEDGVPSSRPRSFGMSHENAASFLLFHTFQLPSQSGPSQVALLAATKTTGVRILAACRDNYFRCFYFQLEESSDEVHVVPKARTLNCFPLEKDWKVGALSSVPRKQDCDSADLVAYITYRPATKDQVLAESEISHNSLLILAEVDLNDDSSKDNPAKCDSCCGILPFLPHGCNQLIWWENPNDRARFCLVIPGQDEQIYATVILPEENRSPELLFGKAFQIIPEMKNFPTLTSINALEYMDMTTVDGVSQRILAVSHSSRSEIVVGSINLQTNEWTKLWVAQHDSMTSRMRLFEAGQEVNLLVVGLCEAVVVYRNIISTKRPKVTVLPGSNQHDLVTCCGIADVDRDGQLEIILGTYGRTVLMYKLDVDGEPSLLQTIETAFPVHYVAMAALTGSDTHELLVVTQKGVHVYCLL